MWQEPGAVGPACLGGDRGSGVLCFSSIYLPRGQSLAQVPRDPTPVSRCRPWPCSGARSPGSRAAVRAAGQSLALWRKTLRSPFSANQLEISRKCRVRWDGLQKLDSKCNAEQRRTVDNLEASHCLSPWSSIIYHVSIMKALQTNTICLSCWQESTKKSNWLLSFLLPFLI